MNTVAKVSDAAGIWIDWGETGKRSDLSMILSDVPILEALGAGPHAKARVFEATLQQAAAARRWPDGYRRPCLETLLGMLLEYLSETPATLVTIERLR